MKKWKHNSKNLQFFGFTIQMIAQMIKAHIHNIESGLLAS